MLLISAGPLGTFYGVVDSGGYPSAFFHVFRLEAETPVYSVFVDEVVSRRITN